MGRSIVYCSICGCPFEDIAGFEGEFNEEALPRIQRKWLEHFRVIGKTSFSGKPESGDLLFSVSAPASDAEFRAVYIGDTITNEKNESEWASFSGRKWKILEQNEAGIVLYPMHDVCIAITEKMASRHSARKEKYATLESYYEAMLRLHERNTVPPPLPEEQAGQYNPGRAEYGQYKLEWEHGYYGTERFADGSDWWIQPGWEWTCAEPVEIPGLTSCILRHLQPIEGTSQAQDQPTFKITSPASERPVQSLESLPIEVITVITSYLPITAILRLYRSSQTLASKITLDQTFWRDQLIHGHLVEYLWDLHVEECMLKDKEKDWDWRRRAQELVGAKFFESALAQSLNGETDGFSTEFEKMNIHEMTFRDAPIGLQNRCRIIKIVRAIEKLDKIEAEEPFVLEDGVAVKRRVGSLFKKTVESSSKNSG